MKIELHINGHMQVEMTPETAIEAVVLRAMLAGAEKGQVVTLAGTDDAIVVSVEK